MAQFDGADTSPYTKIYDVRSKTKKMQKLERYNYEKLEQQIVVPIK